jgi:uncharacterized radical SAM superfamily Fe-S cluster-containing enzyme
MKLGLCEKCGHPCQAAYEIRNNQVYLVKFCRKCGRTASLVSRDARKWRWKRQITGYEDSCATGCSLDCAACSHDKVTAPNTVAIDVTNRCNQKCPICLAYVDAMGFTFHPPIEYFDKIFAHYRDLDPKPNICFFGGEPTVHDDFPSIVRLAKSYGFQVQLFTNGIKLADTEYCRALCGLGIQINFGLDGTDPQIYRTLRGDNSLAVKKRAFENVIRCGVNKLVVVSTVARGVNEHDIPRLMEFIHERREHVSVWAFVPLTPCWRSDDVRLSATTTECVESIFENYLPGIEFVPTGMMKFKVLSRFFGRQTLGGSHPNCESATLVVSDGATYRPISKYLKIPLSELLTRLRRIDDDMAAGEGNSSWWGRTKRALETARAIVRVGALFAGALKLKSLLKRPRLRHGFMALVDPLLGKKFDRVLAERTSFQNVLTLLTIPYEDTGGLENERLKDCPAVFAYEDVETGEIRSAAFCSWQTVKDDVLKRIQAHYDAKKSVAGPRTRTIKRIGERTVSDRSAHDHAAPSR